MHPGASRSCGGPRREQSLRKPAGRLEGHWNSSEPQGFPPAPGHPPDPKLSSKTEEGAVSITMTTKNKNKPKPILRYNLLIA